MTVDFSGYATRNNVRCSDGRTILPDAFKDNDGAIVPLVWSHGHNEPTNILGYATLENVADGVRAHASFNQTAAGIHAKEAVRHGDVKFLSIFANQLIEKAKQVIKGNIREVSLVVAGANPGAVIDHVSFAHGDGEDFIEDGEAYISTGLEIELVHADGDDPDDSEKSDDTDKSGSDKTLEEIMETLNPEQEEAVSYLLTQALTHSDTSTEADPADGGQDDPDADTGAQDDPDAGTDADADTGAQDDPDAGTETEAGDAVQHDNTQEDDSMTHNLFENRGAGTRPQVTLSHSDVAGIVANAKKNGSLKGAMEDFLEHTGITVNGELKHGIENIDYLFPDAKTLENSPAYLSRRMEWVDKVLSGVRKSPFSRIKTITADITPDEARARGYIKGNFKNEEFFALSKRVTTPQTVYKKQKLDRDDVIDIVDLDVVAWLKAEMKVMLDEEIAGAILIGDGRSIGDEDKILETNIRPIASDAELYVTTVNVNLLDANSSIEELVDATINNRQYYKGSGTPTFYTSEAIIARFLTVKDSFGRRIYTNIQEVANVLRVSEIVPVEVMDRVPDLIGIMVNLSDYTLGADRGGQATMFDDFDIDYNKLRYLIETRLSGALTQPKAALVFRATAGSSVLVAPDAPAFNESTNVLTVPTKTGVVYKNEAGTTLTTGSPVTLTTETSPYKVLATPASGYHFENNANDEWTFNYQD